LLAVPPAVALAVLDVLVDFPVALAAGLAAAFGFVVCALGVLEVDEPPEVVELSGLCAAGPDIASTVDGERAINTLRALASQRAPVDTDLWGVGLGEITTFIPQLYDELDG
jgi:hypothetical protein